MGWEATAKPGDEVVFVGWPKRANYVGRRRVPTGAYLAEGRVYVIRRIEMRSKWPGPSFYVGVDTSDYGPVWHHHSGFRPVEFDPIETRELAVA